MEHGIEQFFRSDPFIPARWGIEVIEILVVVVEHVVQSVVKSKLDHALIELGIVLILARLAMGKEVAVPAGSLVRQVDVQSVEVTAVAHNRCDLGLAGVRVGDGNTVSVVHFPPWRGVEHPVGQIKKFAVNVGRDVRGRGGFCVGLV